MLDISKGSGVAAFRFEEVLQRTGSREGFSGFVMQPKPASLASDSPIVIHAIELAPNPRPTYDEHDYSGYLCVGTGLACHQKILGSKLFGEPFPTRVRIPARTNLMLFVDGRWPKCSVKLHWELDEKLGHG